jgi:hypothetical protein
LLHATLGSSCFLQLGDAAKLTQIPFPVKEKECYWCGLTCISSVHQSLLPRFPFSFACAFDYECSLSCASGSWELFQAQDLSFPFSFVLIAGHLLVFISIGVRELVQRNIFFKLLTFGEAYLIYHGIINKGEKHMKYLVMVSDLVARQVYVDASSKEEALENANYGKWRLPEDVEHEEVVDRQAVEILEEEGEDK